LLGEKAIWSAEGKKVIANLITPSEFQQLFRLDDWNDVMVIAKGNNFQHYLNNQLVLDFSDNEPKLALLEGIIALQLHAGKPMWAEYKNIELATWTNQ
jgi:hypothetical protein